MKIFFRNCIFIVLIIFLGGCSFFSKVKKDFSRDFKAAAVKTPLRFAKMLAPDLLEKGKSILMVPFLPGENVGATEEFNKTVLMMVRGVFDVFEEKKARFEMMTQENMEKSDFIIEGRVVECFEPRWFSKFFLRRQTKILKIEGKMIDLPTGRVVLSFEDEIFSKRKEISYSDLGYVLGARIGKFIVAQEKIKKSN